MEAGRGAATATLWSDAPTRASLQVVAEGAAALAGFRHAVISVRVGDVLEVVATSGSEAAELLGTTMPVEVLECELARSDAWGDLRFVPHDRVDTELLGYSRVLDLEPADGPEAWHPLDLLAAPVYDDEGGLRGLLSVDGPLDGRRPDEAQRQVLARYADLTRSSVLMALQREKLEQRVRMMTEVRELVRRALGQPTLELVIEACRSALVRCFGATGMWLSAIDADGGLSGAWYSEWDHDRPPFEEMTDLAVELASRYWADQYVAHFSRARNVHPGLSPEHPRVLADFLDGIGIGSVLFIPLGAGRECLGFLVLARVSDDPPWSGMEYDAARDIGHDLGRAVASARQLDMERALVARLRELDNYRTQLINTVAHEVRSPLSAIVGNLELVELDEDISDRCSRLVAAALRGAHRIDGVVDNLLILARLSDPRVEFHPVDVDLRAVVRDVVDECAAAATAGRVTITTDLPGAAVLVPGEPDELHRAVANLLGNAIKYSDEASTVVVGLESREHDVVLTVVDRGLGISEEDQRNLFREFNRSSNPEALRRPGTGLGLVIVERTVRRHGGDIRVESTLGDGTTVTLTLPAAAR